VSWGNEALPDYTWNLYYPFGKGHNCMVWGTPKLPYWQELLPVAKMKTY